MKISRRGVLPLIAAAPAILLSRKSAAEALSAEPSKPGLEITPGPFKGTRESLREWRSPTGTVMPSSASGRIGDPQSGVEYGDWYARNMYIQGKKQYEYHVKTYGHPRRSDTRISIPTWKADQVRSRSSAGALQKSRSEVLLQHGGAS